MKTPITPGRYRTRDGRVVKVWLPNHVSDYPVVGEVGDRLCTWTLCGRYTYVAECPEDLVARVRNKSKVSPRTAALRRLRSHYAERRRLRRLFYKQFPPGCLVRFRHLLFNVSELLWVEGELRLKLERKSDLGGTRISYADPEYVHPE